MADNMQSDALRRFNQMYSNAQPKKAPPVVDEKKPEMSEESKIAIQEDKQSGNFLDVLMRDKEKSLILILIVLLISEKADSTLILALLYTIL